MAPKGRDLALLLQLRFLRMDPVRDSFRRGRQDRPGNVLRCVRDRGNSFARLDLDGGRR